MKKKQLMPQDQVFFYFHNQAPPQLTHTIKTDVVIVGGGMAGLSAAQRFHEKGCSVVLLEKNLCGSGASGKSSGFITPDSELNLSYFDRLFGSNAAKMLWEFVLSGLDHIEHNIRTLNLNCDYQIQDTLVVANSMRACSKIKLEHQTRQKLSYESFWHDRQHISSIVGSDKYYGGVHYSKTFGINAYHYARAIKEYLQSCGVKIFEETPVINIHARGVDTMHATVEAEHVVVCVDRFVPDLEKLRRDIYHAQTFLMISAPLSDDEVKKIFPDKRLMVWDTDLIYQYYRVTGDNRFMIGGSNLVSIFWGKEQHNSRFMFNKLLVYTKKHFPDVHMNFDYFWPGLIGVSKDIMPIADFDDTLSNVYYISGAAGLPWAAALGCYAAEKLVTKRNDLDEFFSRKRKFPVGNIFQSMLGKRITFALSNFITLMR